jgi:hypothetical protein
MPGALGNSDGNGICHSYPPDGRCISLLKILLTNYCIYDCQYCVNRVSSDVARARFSTQEVVDVTLEFCRRYYIEGLFLSSGIIQCAPRLLHGLQSVPACAGMDRGPRRWPNTRASAVSGRLADPALRIQCGGADDCSRAEPSIRDEPQARVGAPASGSVPR